MNFKRWVELWADAMTREFGAVYKRYTRDWLNAREDRINNCLEEYEVCKDSCEKPLKLEAGKRYVLRNGKETGPIQHTGDRYYPWTSTLVDCGRITWRKNGYWINNFGNDAWDIVAECIGPKPEFEPFDLARAKAGEPIQTRSGQKASFIAFESALVRPLIIRYNGEDVTRERFSDGRMTGYDSGADIVMAPSQS